MSDCSGAGLSGLTLAIALRKFAPDVHFEVYEGASQLFEIGAGIVMQDRARAVMKALDIGSLLATVSGGGERQSKDITHHRFPPAISR